MGKHEETFYTCDRCSKVINGDAHSIGLFHYMHVLKWYCPVSGYRLAYLCNDCYKELKEFLTAKKEAEHGFALTGKGRDEHESYRQTAHSDL